MGWLDTPFQGVPPRKRREHIMGQYQYVAKSSKGETLGGVLQAESAADARQRLRQQGLFVLSLSAETAPRVRTSSASFFRKRAPTCCWSARKISSPRVPTT